MKGIFFIIISFFPILVFSQISVTSANGQNVKDFLETHFLGGGIQISNVKFNGQSVVNSNQIGSFTNADTNSPNVGLSSGIVLVTGELDDAAAGNIVGNESTISNPPYDGRDKSIALSYVVDSDPLSAGRDIFDVAILQLDFVSSQEYISFDYVFASEEYPEYVNAAVNDVFGFFISGPYDEQGNPVYEGITYQYKNMAVIPATGDLVTINNVHDLGNSYCGSGCTHQANSAYHILNNNNNCKMDGYTVVLSTEEVYVVPCYKYKLEIAICDVSDAGWNSCVFLGANSFKVEEFSLNTMTPSSGEEEIYIKGCDSDTIMITVNSPVTETQLHTISFFGSAVEGEDFELVDFNGNLASRTLTFEEGDTSASVIIRFKNHSTDIPGEILDLGVVMEYVNECTKSDTIYMNILTPEDFTYTISDDVIYCENELPRNENVEINVSGGIGDVTYEWSAGVTPNQATNTIGVTQPSVVYVTATDGCGRQLQDSVSFKVQAATVSASVDKQFICEGEVVNLSATQAVDYTWTSTAEDLLLQNNSTQRNPQAQPSESCTYKVTIVDENGCIASDTVNVVVVPAIDAQLYLTPTRTSVLNTQIRFEDRTQGSFSREWDFGNGETSTQANGVVVYSSNDTATYQVRLIAYNQANCPDTAYGTVQVVPEFSIWVPTAFTPGTDDINAYFTPIFSTETEYEFTIYSRNGDKIFMTDNEKRAWDGKLKNGDYAPNGSYVYDLYYKDGDGLLQRRTGTVALVMAGNKEE
ncbi:MAG: choice-of-anchor L domain-containing protein [Bacteroidales bacterium]|nr:choice-of-anchor L domain-containing protein [Bacteroidales bacterium]